MSFSEFFRKIFMIFVRSQRDSFFLRPKKVRRRALQTTKSELTLIAAAGNHGAQQKLKGGIQHARCHGNAEHVVKECPEKIFLDVFHNGARKLDSIRHSGQASAYQDTVGRFLGNLCTGSDGDGGRSKRKRRGRR